MSVHDSSRSAFGHVRDFIQRLHLEHAIHASCNHLLPPYRGTVRLISTIDVARRYLDAIRADLEQTQVNRHSQVMMSLSPIGGLPVELLREIFSYAIEDPANYRGITRIASVCGFWRAVVTGVSSFFVQANWDSWPPWLLERWCARANGRQLTIKLSAIGSTRLLQPSQTEFKQALQSTRKLWGCLEIQNGRISASEREAIAQMLFGDELPSLRRLRVAVPRSSSLTHPTIIPIRANLPVLQHLHLDGVLVQPLKQFSKLTHKTMNLSSSSSWLEWSRAIQPLGGITSLTLMNVRPGNLIGHSMLELPSLTELRLESSPDDRTITSLLQSISLPNARSVFLHNIIYYSNFDIPCALSRCAPNLTSLSIVEVDNRWLACATRQVQALCSFSNGEFLLSCLEELRLVRNSSVLSTSKMNINVTLEDTLRGFAASRRIMRLELPTRFISNECERELKGFIRHLMITDIR